MSRKIPSIVIAASFAAAMLTGLQTESIAGDAASEYSDAALIRKLPGLKSTFVEVNDLRIHIVRGGRGSPVALLPGWPQTWWSFHKIMPELAAAHEVIAVDLRGMGSSDTPSRGYDKKTMAGDIAALVQKLGFKKVDVVGHDIGSMVAFSFGANHPELTRRIVMIDVAHPDSGLATWPLLHAVGTFEDKVGDGSHAYPW